MIIVIHLGMDQFANLLLGGCHNYGVAVPCIGYTDARSEIDIALSSGVIDITAFSAVDGEWEDAFPK